MNKNQKLILYICTFFTFLFLILSISLQPVHYRFKKYTDRDDVAAYIYKYNSLPRNYILEEENPYDNSKDALRAGLSFGGKEYHDYEEKILEFTSNRDLREADYYPNLEENLAIETYEPGRGPRGEYRLVYTASGEKRIFYTENHYDTFAELNVPKKFIASKIMKVFLYISYSGVVLIIVQHQIALNRRKKHERENN